MTSTTTARVFSRSASSFRNATARSFWWSTSSNSASVPENNKIVDTAAKTTSIREITTTMRVTREDMKAATGDIREQDKQDFPMEERWTLPHESMDTKKPEWGGPTRGGRLLEPTRYGDWERKGRCTDFS